jgi:hypothetical protein
MGEVGCMTDGGGGGGGGVGSAMGRLSALLPYLKCGIR